MAEEAKTEAAKPAPMIFKGMCSDGVLKGKEIQGKLDIKVNVKSVISIPVTPFGMVRWESSVGSRPRSECGIIDLDFIIPMQPETISQPQKHPKKQPLGGKQIFFGCCFY